MLTRPCNQKQEEGGNVTVRVVKARNLENKDSKCTILLS